MGRPKDAIKIIGGQLSHKPVVIQKPRITLGQKVHQMYAFDPLGKPIKNYEQKFEVIKRHYLNSIPKFDLQNPLDIDLIRYSMQYPPVDVVSKYPEVFFSKESTSTKKIADIIKKFPECRSWNEFQDLVFDANTGIEDCKYIIKQLTGKKGSDAVEIKRLAEIKLEYLTNQLAKENIDKNMANAYKAYGSILFI